jgi:hypothetical protein
MEKQAQMFNQAKEWKTSGISMKQYAQQHGINYKSFVYWCRKLKINKKSPLNNIETSQQPINPTFVEIINNPANGTANNRPVQIELELASGLRIKIY